MPGKDTPVQDKSSETVTDADVQRLLNIALTGAGLVEGLTSEHDDAPDVLESALPLLRSSAQVGGQAVIIVWGILDRHNWGFLHSH